MLKPLIKIISILILALFLYAGFSKLLEYNDFKEEISLSPILAPISGLIAWAIPAIEIVIALVLLFIPSYRIYGFYASLGLMVLFTFYIIAIITINKHILCSCGGVLEQLSWKQHIAFNVGFILLAIAGILLEKKVKRGYSRHESI